MRNEEMYHRLSWAEYEERYGESRADFEEDGWPPGNRRRPKQRACHCTDRYENLQSNKQLSYQSLKH